MMTMAAAMTMGGCQCSGGGYDSNRQLRMKWRWWRRRRKAASTAAKTTLMAGGCQCSGDDFGSEQVMAEAEI
jgi:hypothetical protein